ncbi:MAG: thioredoxin family protein [Burkholderiales bacterium]|jgi:thiol:disulfide interchange protein DsbD|nr:thioredoxin family protein [Burkholderiales bacterium]
MFHSGFRYSWVARLTFLALPLLLLVFSASVLAQHVKAELVSDHRVISAGGAFRIALRLSIESGWHTYWKNPGDTGLPTTIKWRLPANITMAGATQWPAPQAHFYGPYLNYGYEGEVLLITEFVAAENIAPTPLIFEARADWLMCRDICIPDGADVALMIDVGEASIEDDYWKAVIEKGQNDIPRPLVGWMASARGVGDTIELSLTPEEESGDPGALYFFSEDERVIEPSFAQTLRRDGDTLVLTLPVSHQIKDGLTQLSGVLRAQHPWSPDRTTSATINAPVIGMVTAGIVPTFTASPAVEIPGMTRGATVAKENESDRHFSLWLAMLFAFVGGMILNLMPCVFPVISIKVLGLVRHHDSRATMRREAYAFASGVIITFLFLALVLLALRSAGTHLGWGFQLQSPPVVIGLTVLFCMMALNLSGVFEFGQIVPSSLAGWTSKNRLLDAFSSGILAVVVASPCTAPFMGAAIGYALTQNVLTVIVIFTFLGLGIALPFVLLAIFPSWQHRLPKPGVWMERLRQFLAFPLYATVAWLTWVLGAQTDEDAVLRMLLALIALALALWAWHSFRMAVKRKILWILLFVLSLLSSAWLIMPILTYQYENTVTVSKTTRQDSDVWRVYDATEISRLNAEGKTVFVDFTAAWCVTCQFNKKMVLDTEKVQKAFVDHDIILMRADWTRRDPEISDALDALGRNGVPVYVFFQQGKKPILLPELLQSSTVIAALKLLS